MKVTSARAKFDRARAHRLEYIERGVAWVKTIEDQPLPMKREVTANPDGTETVSFSIGEPTIDVPEEYALRLGDALYNYRSALDHLAWALVLAAGEPKNPEAVQYPVVARKANFESAFKGRMPGVSDVIRLVVERQQPFNNGAQYESHPLWLLHRWNLTDKHRSIPIVLMAPQKVNVSVEADYPNFNVIQQEVHGSGWDYLLPGTELLRLHGRRKDPTQEIGRLIRVQGQMTVSHETGPVIESVLDVIEKNVDSVLSDFERLP